jgi:hypothetical protein
VEERSNYDAGEEGRSGCGTTEWRFRCGAMQWRSGDLCHAIEAAWRRVCNRRGTVRGEAGPVERERGIEC